MCNKIKLKKINDYLKSKSKNNAKNNNIEGKCLTIVNKFIILIKKIFSSILFIIYKNAFVLLVYRYRVYIMI